MHRAMPGFAQGAGFDVGAEAMEEAALGAVPIDAAHRRVKQEFGTADNDTGQAGLMGFNQAGTDPMVDAALHVKGFGRST